MENHKNISQDIFDELMGAQDILIISHKKPDGDTLGSNLAFFSYLTSQGKNVTSFCLDEVPKNLAFLDHSHQITTDHKVFTKKYDIVLAVDCANLEYAGVADLVTALPKPYKVINIDHHVTNPKYGDINLVIDSSSSTAEVIYRLFRDWKIKWTQDIATALMAGLLTDTTGFTNSATSYQSLEAGAALISHGAKSHEISQIAIKTIELDNLKLWGIALDRLTKVDKYNLVYTWLTQEDFKACGVSETGYEGLANFLHILKDGKVILVLTERDDQVKGSMRTTADIDLTKLAGLFGGGGHKKAAGFSLPGKLVYDNNRLRIE